MVWRHVLPPSTFLLVHDAMWAGIGWEGVRLVDFQLRGAPHGLCKRPAMAGKRPPMAAYSGLRREPGLDYCVQCQGSRASILLMG
jgi:hypothetical protein